MTVRGEDDDVQDVDKRRSVGPAVESRFLAPASDDEQAWLQWAEQLPASQAMNLRAVQITAGRAVMKMDTPPWPLNPNGSVHGGLIAAAADHSGGVVAISSLGAAALPATATLHGEFLRPAFPGLVFACETVKTGRSLVFADILVYDVDDRLCAKFAGTWSVNAGATPAPREQG